jgi:DNA-binding Lrp family transcriptional regulator
MVTAVVLLNVERKCIHRVAEELAAIPHVSEVYSVSGRYDLIALIRVSEVDSLAELVTRELLSVDGITHSETMLAFRSYSRHDLEHLFGIGIEGP